MRVQEVLDRLDAIRGRATWDDEVAHSLEDRLWSDVLQSIADNTAEHPQEMARLALTSSEIEFSRWYA